MRIQLLLLWALHIMNTIPLGDAFVGSFSRRQRRMNLTSLPADPSSGCKVMKDGDVHIMMGDTCNTMPKNYPIMGTELHLKTTGITTLRAGDLRGYTHLKSLTIEMNSKLQNISTGFFEDMTNIIYLSISNNLQLQYLDHNMFLGLVNLQHLRLVKNSYTSFYCISVATRPSILPSLIFLDVSENTFHCIENDDTHFLNQSTLQYLKLSLCSLDEIEPTAFNNLPHLKGLHVDKNNLQTDTLVNLVLNLTSSSKNFTEIHMGANYISDPNEVLFSIAPTQISILDFSNSHFYTLIAQNIPSLPSIKYLDFSGTSAIGLTNESFTSEKLPNIQNLYLAHNRLLGSFFTISLPTLKVLDLSDNSNSIFSTGDFDLSGMKSLESLKLDSNPIGTVKQNYFNGLSKLKELYLFNASISTIEPAALSELEELEVLDLSYNSFITGLSINNNTFKGLNKLKSLNLDQCEITCLDDDVTFRHTPNLEFLSLKKNSLLELHHHILLPVPNLRFLDISYNTFQNWDQTLFDNNKDLDTVNLSYNQISAFTPAMLNDLKHVKHIILIENSLSCLCSDLAILNPFLSSPTGDGQFALVKALNDSSPVCSSPITARFTPFLEKARKIHTSGECSPGRSVVVFVIIGIGGVIALTIPVIYFLRWHIKYWLFLIRQAFSCYIFPKIKHTEQQGKYIYDAFVSYSNEDRGFVVRLVSMLESHAPYFRLCVFERDFSVGGVITDNVVENLGKSRRTILILSDSFARSTWCQWELKLAQHKRLFFKDDQNGPLIIIKIGEIMEKHMTPTLRYLIKTRIYLQWNSEPIKQKVFWEKLRSALTAPLKEDEDSDSTTQHKVLTNGDTVNNNNYSNQSFEV